MNEFVKLLEQCLPHKSITDCKVKSKILGSFSIMYMKINHENEDWNTDWHNFF